MKKTVTNFNKIIEQFCYPIDPFIVYLFMVIALLCPAIIKLL